MAKTGQEKQSDYRARRAKQGIVPYQLQVFAKDRVLFEKMAAAEAEGLVQTYTKNTIGSAEARRALFHKLVIGQGAEFHALREQISPSMQAAYNSTDFLKQELERYRLKVQDSLDVIEHLSNENETLKKKLGIKNGAIDFDAI